MDAVVSAEVVWALARDELRVRCQAGRGRLQSLDEAGTGLWPTSLGKGSRSRS